MGELTFKKIKLPIGAQGFKQIDAELAKAKSEGFYGVEWENEGVCQICGTDLLPESNCGHMRERAQMPTAIFHVCDPCGTIMAQMMNLQTVRWALN